MPNDRDDRARPARPRHESPRPYEEDPPRSRGGHDVPKDRKSKSGLNESFIDGDGINREVLQRNVAFMLGPEACSKPGTYQGIQGYTITAVRPFTPEQLADLVRMSETFEQGTNKYRPAGPGTRPHHDPRGDKPPGISRGKGPYMNEHESSSLGRPYESGPSRPMGYHSGFPPGVPGPGPRNPRGEPSSQSERMPGPRYDQYQAYGEHPGIRRDDRDRPRYMPPEPLEYYQEIGRPSAASRYPIQQPTFEQMDVDTSMSGYEQPRPRRGYPNYADPAMPSRDVTGGSSRRPAHPEGYYDQIPYQEMGGMSTRRPPVSHYDREPVLQRDIGSTPTRGPPGPEYYQEDAYDRAPYIAPAYAMENRQQSRPAPRDPRDPRDVDRNADRRRHR